MSDNFRVGQKVVCVDDAFPGHELCLADTLLRAGYIYTIAAVVAESCVSRPGPYPGIHLVEINRPLSKHDGRVLAYRASRFRPIVERKTDISIFTKMLTKDTVKA
jgi:hypothetical protein